MKKKPDYGKLAASVIIDAIGMATSALIPVLGDVADVMWAPVSAMLVYFLYRNMWVSGFNTVEELLPMTDFIPTATIMWVIETYGD